MSASSTATASPTMNRSDIIPENDVQSRESSVFEIPEYTITYSTDHTLLWHPARGSKELAVALSYHFPLEATLSQKMQAATAKFLKSESRKRRGDKARESGDVSSSKDKCSAENSCQTSSKLHHPLEAIQAGEITSNHSTSSNTSIAPADKEQEALAEVPSVISKEYTELNKPSKSPALSLPQPQSSSSLQPFVSQPEAKQTATPLKIISWSPNDTKKAKGRKRRRYAELERQQVAANRGNVCKEHKTRKVKCLGASCPNHTQPSKSDGSSLENTPVTSKSLRSLGGMIGNARVSSLALGGTGSSNDGVFLQGSDSLNQDANINSSKLTDENNIANPGFGTIIFPASLFTPADDGDRQWALGLEYIGQPRPPPLSSSPHPSPSFQDNWNCTTITDPNVLLKDSEQSIFAQHSQFSQPVCHTTYGANDSGINPLIRNTYSPDLAWTPHLSEITSNNVRRSIPGIPDILPDHSVARCSSCGSILAVSESRFRRDDPSILLCDYCYYTRDTTASHSRDGRRRVSSPASSPTRNRRSSSVMTAHCAFYYSDTRTETERTVRAGRYTDDEVEFGQMVEAFGNTHIGF